MKEHKNTSLLEGYKELTWWIGTKLPRSLKSITNQKMGNQKIMIIWMIMATQVEMTMEVDFTTFIKEIEHYQHE